MNVLRRAGRLSREIRRGMTAATAADAIGPITPGCEIYGLSKGQYSLVDILEHCLRASGPADVLLSTWTAAGADLGFAHGLMTNGAIRSLRFVVDFSFPRRQPEYCAMLRERFGDAAIRITKTHAKFCVVTNDAWALVIRSSMNLNENRRLESFEISDDRQMADYLAEVVESLFVEHAAGSQFVQRPFDNVKDFERWQEIAPADQAAIEQAALAGDRGRYFRDGPLEPDLRRAGWSYVETKRKVE